MINIVCFANRKLYRYFDRTRRDKREDSEPIGGGR